MRSVNELSVSWVLLAVLITHVMHAYDVFQPIVSYVDGNANFAQVFNPSWVVPTVGTGGKQGLLIRSQNCTATVGGPCVTCNGDGAKASVIAFAEIKTTDNVSLSLSMIDHVSKLEVRFDYGRA